MGTLIKGQHNLQDNVRVTSLPSNVSTGHEVGWNDSTSHSTSECLFFSVHSKLKTSK